MDTEKKMYSVNQGKTSKYQQTVKKTACDSDIKTNDRSNGTPTWEMALAGKKVH